MASWQLLAGRGPGALQEALTKPRGGFETRLPIPKGGRYAAVVALDAEGNALRGSKTVRV